MIMCFCKLSEKEAIELKKNLKSNIMETQTTLRQAGARGGRQDLYRDLQSEKEAIPVL
jgi:hypothetical protein